MGLLEQQNLMARIFTDENLRHLFWENPEKIGTENGLNLPEINQIKKIVADDLNFFADSLVHKRLHEVEKLLPLTRKALQKDFPRIFRQFARTFQPHSVKKHLEDAIEFCRFLQLQNFEPGFLKETAKFEQTKHEFYAGKKNIAFCLLKNDIFNRQKKYGFSIWYRIGKQTGHLIW